MSRDTPNSALVEGVRDRILDLLVPTQPELPNDVFTDALASALASQAEQTYGAFDRTKTIISDVVTVKGTKLRVVVCEADSLWPWGATGPLISSQSEETQTSKDSHTKE